MNHDESTTASLSAEQVLAALRRQPNHRLLRAEHPGLSDEAIDRALRMAATGRASEAIELHARA